MSFQQSMVTFGISEKGSTPQNCLHYAYISELTASWTVVTTESAEQFWAIFKIFSKTCLEGLKEAVKRKPADIRYHWKIATTTPQRCVVWLGPRPRLQRGCITEDWGMPWNRPVYCRLCCLRSQGSLFISHFGNRFEANAPFISSENVPFVGQVRRPL
jgi:hypothetical protein